MTTSDEMKRFTCSLLVGAALLAPAAARAEAVWTGVPATCEVDEDSVARFQHVAAAVRFRGSTTGSITLRCNVANPRDDGLGPAWTALEVVFQDQDGPGTNATVNASLFRVDDATGSSLLIAGFSSTNAGTTTALQKQSAGLAFRHTFDFSTGAYYVLIQLTRTSTAVDPAVIAVRMKQNTPSPCLRCE